MLDLAEVQLSGTDDAHALDDFDRRFKRDQMY